MSKKNTLGKTLRSLRKAKKWTQLDLAERANVARSYITHLELDNRTPSMGALRKLAQALGVNTTVLVVD
jgi:transcriptional regulator with XRE-family HTH domain